MSSSPNTKKREISDLYGLSVTDINAKLSELKLIIPDESDEELLDYLLKSDLNIEQAINLHFSSTPSPQLSQQSDHNHNNNNNENNDNDANDDINDNHSDSIYKDSDEDDWEPPSEEDNDLEYDPDDDETNRNRKKRIICHSPSTSPSISPSPLPRSNENTNNKRRIRKRKRDKMEADSDDNDQDDDNIENRFKRRRIESPKKSNSNTNNVNINNSVENRNNHNRNDTDSESDDNNDDVIDRNWTQKTIGTLRFEYEQNKLVPPFVYIHGIATALRHNSITITKVEATSISINEASTTQLYSESIKELSAHYCPLIKINTVNKGNEVTAEEQDQYEIEYQRALQLVNKRMKIKNSIHAKRKAEQMVAKPGTFSVECTIEMKRRANQNGEMSNSYFPQIPNTLRLFCESKPLLDDIEHVMNIGDTFTEQGHTLTMQGLLDFTCRYEYDITEDNDDESYNHGLNVKLHDYQLQSLDYMINTENNPRKFRCNFYKKGRFSDNSPFWYSTTFNHLVFDKKAIPIIKGGFLCEEMGLGKTIISLALICCNAPTDNLNEYSTKKRLKCIKSENKQKSRWDRIDPDPMNWKRVQYTVTHQYYKSRATLVIAPVSLVGQWERECNEKFVGRKLKCKRYHGTRSRKIQDYVDQDVVFTTYGILGVENGDEVNKHVLHHIIWHRIILDESDNIKSSHCNSSQSILRLKAEHKWCLTGTPFGTQINDISNQLRFIGLSQQQSQALHVPASDLTRYKSQRNALMNVMKHMIMRHKKDQKFNDQPIVKMPEKEQDVIYIEFTQQQREYYDKLYNTAKERYNYFKSTDNIGRGSIQILSSLHPARQACSGWIYSKDTIEQQLADAEARTFHVQQMVNNNKNLSRQELYAMAKEEAFNDEDGECPICYECPFDAPLQTPCRHIFCGECIVGILQNKPECPMCRKKCSVPQLKQPPSEEKRKEIENGGGNEDNQDNDDEKRESNEIRFDSKMKVLMNALKKIKEEKPEDKALIFTSFSKSLDWICKELKQNGIEYRTLTGSMTMNKRKKQLDQFTNDPNVKVFVLTVRSGAVGITLTAANHVFMMEPPFNPALHRQAINRVYRLGQKKKVYIHTFIMKNSIEERIWNINKEKQGDDEDDNDESGNNDGNKNKQQIGIAGNLKSDKSNNLDQHEISKLFEEN